MSDIEPQRERSGFPIRGKRAGTPDRCQPMLQQGPDRVRHSNGLTSRISPALPVAAIVSSGVALLLAVGSFEQQRKIENEIVSLRAQLGQNPAANQRGNTLATVDARIRTL